MHINTHTPPHTHTHTHNVIQGDEFITASEGEEESCSVPKQPSPRPSKRKPGKSKTEGTTGEDIASTTKLWLQFTVHKVCS